MTTTIISSATKEVRIGFDQPFVVIGERINPTGRKILAEEMKNGDYSRVEADALAQVAAGAQMLDVNAGIPLADEPRILAEAIQLVQSVTDVPLSIDSSIVEALESGLAVYQGKPWLTRLRVKMKFLSVCFLWSPNTAQLLLPFQMTRPASLKIPMCVLRWQRRLLSVLLTTEFLMRMWSLIRW